MAGAGATPTGSVDFYDVSYNIDLGSVTLSGGQATFPVTPSVPGAHVYLLTYSGSATYARSTSYLVLDYFASGKGIGSNVIIATPPSTSAFIPLGVGAPSPVSIPIYLTFPTPDAQWPADGAATDVTTLIAIESNPLLKKHFRTDDHAPASIEGRDRDIPVSARLEMDGTSGSKAGLDDPGGRGYLPRYTPRMGWRGSWPSIGRWFSPVRRRWAAISRRRSPHVVLRSSSRRPPPSLGAWAHHPPVRAARRPTAPLDGRAKADLLATQFTTVHTADWGDQIHATGTIANRGTADDHRPGPRSTSTPRPRRPSPRRRDGRSSWAPVAVPAGLAPGATYNFDQIVAAARRQPTSRRPPRPPRRSTSP